MALSNPDFERSGIFLSLRFFSQHRLLILGATRLIFLLLWLTYQLQLRHIHRIYIDQIDHFFIHFKLFP